MSGCGGTCEQGRRQCNCTRKDAIAVNDNLWIPITIIVLCLVISFI